LQLLIIADKFTNGAANSLFNTAVGSDGTLKIVDGENIVMVDLEKIRKGNSVA
jgi:hypothetical protein